MNSVLVGFLVVPGITLLFALVAIVADDYLTPAIETMIRRTGMREEVAGALVLALASATPEVAINAAASFGDSGDRETGLSAIMGSGLIAYTLIPAGCLASGSAIQLSRISSFRDIGFYVCCLYMMMLFHADGNVDALEAALLLIMYCIYVITILLTPEPRFLTGWLEEQQRLSRRKEVQEAAEALSPKNLRASEDMIQEDVQTCWEKSWEKFSHYSMFPAVWLLKKTIPDASEGSSEERKYWLAFFISVLYIAAASTGISKLIHLAINSWDLDENVMGCSVVAIGMEVPDFLTSFSVARRGLAQVALSNAIGAQIVNICVGLGVPWLLTRLRGVVVTLELTRDIALLEIAVGIAACLWYACHWFSPPIVVIDPMHELDNRYKTPSCCSRFYEKFISVCEVNGWLWKVLVGFWISFMFMYITILSF